jgi:hypothetical protein
VRHLTRVSLAGSIVLTVVPFLPWMRIGDIGLRGIPDPAGFFVCALGVVGVLLSVTTVVGRRRTREALTLVGVAALTTLVVVWRSGPATIADRAHARAEAIAIVDNVALPPVPPVRVGAGLLLGVAAAFVVAAAAATAVWREQD